jgi:hypothetical protein
MNSKVFRSATRRKLRNRRGNAVIEFALVSLFLVPLLLGTVNVGMNLSRSIQCTQISRDAGHMYVRQVDFSLAANKNLIVRLADGLNMTATGGEGVVILSKLQMIGAAECALANLSVGACPNYNKTVFTHRLVIGNASLRASSVGTPPSGMVASNGAISPNDYLTASTLVASNFSNLLTLQAGENAYVSEAYFSSPSWSFQGIYPTVAVYGRTIF